MAFLKHYWQWSLTNVNCQRNVDDIDDALEKRYQCNVDNIDNVDYAHHSHQINSVMLAILTILLMLEKVLILLI